MREVDRLTTEKYGIPSIILMENAAHAAANVIKEKLGGSVAGKSFLILCGKGNNGGDGAALGRILWTQGANIDVYLFGKIEETNGDARVNLESIQKLALRQNNVKKIYFEEVPLIDYWVHTTGFEIEKFDGLIDALFGTGLTRPFDALYKPLAQICSSKSFLQNTLVFSLDIPSGLNSNVSEQIGENFDAGLTITFTAPKLANVFPPASNFNGELVVANIGSPQELIDNSPSKTFLAEKSDAQKWLEKTKVKTDSYKKTRGTCLIIAGSKDFSGAAVLAANACFAAGAGMVSLAVPNSIKSIVASKTSDEIIVKTLEDIKISDEKVDVIALGCGLSNDEDTRKFIRETVENRIAPMVLDAEALNALAPFDLQGSDEFPLVLTPHIGEFRRLLGREFSEDKIGEVRNFAEKNNVILVLKGERSLIAAPDGTVVINPTGNAGISRAGAGDTLTGIITTFLAQTFGREKPNLENTFETVAAALYVAGLAGDIAAEIFTERLMTASDVRDYLQEAIASITDYRLQITK
jgi:NAD(P)H-hydrate epimerase